MLAFEHDGKCETQEFLSALPERSVRSLDVVMQRLAEVGRAGKGEERFRHLRGPAYEMKEHSSGVRLYCFVSGRALVCTHGSQKRAGRARLNMEIEKVMETYSLCASEGLLG